MYQVGMDAALEYTVEVIGRSWDETLQKVFPS